MTLAASHLLYKVLWRQIFELVGEDCHLPIAGTCRLFRDLYRELHGACKTSAEDLVQTIPGAEFFLRETSDESSFWIEMRELHVRFSRPCSPWEVIHLTAAGNGRLNVLQWSVAQGYLLDRPDTCTFAAHSGNLSVLQWARANGCPWSSMTCLSAALKGHFAVLQWARASGCPWDTGTCAAAAAGGHLTMLQWLRANGCPWDRRTLKEARNNRHSDVLQWARENGCPRN